MYSRDIVNQLDVLVQNKIDLPFDSTNKLKTINSTVLHYVKRHQRLTKKNPVIYKTVLDNIEKKLSEMEMILKILSVKLHEVSIDNMESNFKVMKQDFEVTIEQLDGVVSFLKSVDIKE
jgi:hypothetical protein